jgi:CheY-like chemotaxis protein
MRLQVDDEKVPARPFTLRCPKCQNIVHAQPPAVASHESSAVTVGHSPASGHPRLDAPAPAPPFKLDSSADKAVAQPEKESGSDSKELLRLLGALLQQGTQGAEKWEARRVLVCVGDGHGEAVARSLAEKSEYQVYVAENKAQAFERMRDERMDIIILSPDFDPVEQGTAFITREVGALRPAERRRLFLVQLSSSGRTLDAHAAFINNANLIINPEDVEKTPRALERALRDYNELYRNFNGALGASPI